MAKEERNAAKGSYDLDSELPAQSKEYSRDAGRYETMIIEIVFK